MSLLVTKLATLDLPELGVLLELVEVVGALAEVVAHRLGGRSLVGDEARVAAVQSFSAVLVQLRDEKSHLKNGHGVFEPN